MKKRIFTPGAVYFCTSPCNTDVVFTFRVESRTQKSVTLCGDFPEGKRLKRVSIKTTVSYTEALEPFDEEFCLPLGNYSMAPRLHASDSIF